MGFWHTGYREFHEPAGLDPKFKPQPKRFPCAQCDELYSSPDELLDHRFEAHPLRRPTMFVRGRELGTEPVRITQPLSAADVRIAHCERVRFNGSEILVPCLSDRLTAISFDTCQVVLSKDGVDAEFKLDFRVASKKDLEGVEDQFKKIARGHRLDTHVVEEFIAGASGFATAVGYYDGICAYLYGVLAKEQTGGSHLSYDAYVHKFSEAAKELATYDRPLAQTIGSLIAFHFNRFRDSACLSPESRAGRVAARYSGWIESAGSSSQYETGTDKLESPVTDRETEKILRWASRPLSDLSGETVAIENLLQRASAEYDRVKLHILLGELYAQSRDADQALRHAKVLRNVSGFRGWAEALIETLGGR